MNSVTAGDVGNISLCTKQIEAFCSNKHSARSPINKAVNKPKSVSGAPASEDKQ